MCNHFYFDGGSFKFVLFLCSLVPFVCSFVMQQAFLLFLLSDSLRTQLLFNHCQNQVQFLRGLISIQGLQRTAAKKMVLNSNIRLEAS